MKIFSLFFFLDWLRRRIVVSVEVDRSGRAQRESQLVGCSFDALSNHFASSTQQVHERSPTTPILHSIHTVSSVHGPRGRRLDLLHAVVQELGQSISRLLLRGLSRHQSSSLRIHLLDVRLSNVVLRSHQRQSHRRNVHDFLEHGYQLWWHVAQHGSSVHCQLYNAKEVLRRQK